MQHIYNNYHHFSLLIYKNVESIVLYRKVQRWRCNARKWFLPVGLEKLSIGDNLEVRAKRRQLVEMEEEKMKA